MCNKTLNWARRFIIEEDGPTAIEYAVMLTVITIALLGILATGDVQRLMFESNAEKIRDATNP